MRFVFSEPVRRRGALLLAITAAALAAFAHVAAGPTEVTVKVDRNVPPFGRSAAGISPPSDNEWTISAMEPSGLIATMARCDDEAFFVDLHGKLIHRVRLSKGRDTGHIGLIGDMRLRYPMGTAADCVAQKLYIVDNSGVSVLDFDGRLVNRFAGPIGFAPNSGAPVLDPPAYALYVPGIWTPSQPKWLNRNLEGMFEQDRLGYRLDLLSGETTPMFRPVECDCWTFSSQCLSVALDKVNGAGPVAWIVAQKSSTRIGLFDARYRLLRTLDVRSPMFRQDGRRILRRVSVERQMALQESNSVIRAVYSFDDIIATVHSVNRTRNWRPGEALDFEVFMNLYSGDGTGLVSDIPLPNLPVARDDSGVYVLDYGPAGRTHVRSSPMTLLRFDISSLRWR